MLLAKWLESSAILISSCIYTLCSHITLKKAIVEDISNLYSILKNFVFCYSHILGYICNSHDYSALAVLDYCMTSALTDLEFFVSYKKNPMCLKYTV